jgi:hypothetical protein
MREKVAVRAKPGPKPGSKRVINNRSLAKRKNYRSNQLDIVRELKVLYKELGYKISDGNESLIFAEKDSTFRIFVSRVSHALQFYYLGEGQFTGEYSLKNIESAAEVRELETKYKEEFG